MQPFELLTNLDKERIVNYINEYSGGTTSVEIINNVLREWNSSKGKLLSMFNNQLIITKPIQYTQSVQEIADKMEMDWSNSTSIYHRFRNAIRSAILAADLESEVWWDVRQLFSFEYSLAENKFKGYEFSFEYNDIKFNVPEGCKPIKILGKIAEAFGLFQLFEEFRLEHSLKLNQKALHGELCLSIHPLDYMTMSDNASGWDSCMSWRESGCYRTGTVEMMNSSCVIVAYLRAKDDMKLYDNVTWNNKKWRSLYVVTDELITGVKGYPYCNATIDNIVIEWLKELSPYTFTDLMTISSSQAEGKAFEVGDHEIILNFTTRQMYNDFDTCTHQIVFSNNFLESEDKTLKYNCVYSGETTCVSCGDYKDTLDEECLLCGDCGGGEPCVYCVNCDEELDEEDAYYSPNGDGPYCSDCFYKKYYEDPIDNYFYNDLSTAIKCYLITDDTNLIKDKINNNIPIYIYAQKDKDFYSASQWERVFYCSNYRVKNDIYFIYPGDLTEEGWRTFGFYFKDSRDAYVKDLKNLGL